MHITEITAPPTNKQKEILRAIDRLSREVAYPPTLREICDALEIASTANLHGQLLALQRRGLVSKKPSTARSLLLTPAAAQYVGGK